MSSLIDISTTKSADEYSRRKGRLSIPFIFALFYSMVPWPEIWNNVTGSPMVDRAVYIRAVERQMLLYDRIDYARPIDFISNEFLWGWLLRTSANLGISTDFFLDTVGFLFIFLSAAIINYALPIPFLALLINPLVIGLAYSQSRTALMISVLYIAYLAARKYKLLAIFLMFIAPLIHTSAPLFIILYFFSTRKHKSHTFASSTIGPVLAGVVVAALSGSLMSTVLSIFGDRRAEDYGNMSSGLSILSIWILGMIYLLWRWPVVKMDPYSRVALAVMTLAASSIIFDSYASRFLAALFPICVVALCRNYTWTRRIDLMAIFLIAYIVLYSVRFFTWI